MSKQTRMLFSKLVKHHRQEDNHMFHLTLADQLNSLFRAIPAVIFFHGARLDKASLEDCLRLVCEDLPILSGRLSRAMQREPPNIGITLNNKGALLSIVEATKVWMDALGPDSWVQPSRKQSLLYLDDIDIGRALKGREPLLKVRLTHVYDGDILGVTMSHAIADGMSLIRLMKHFAARYRQVAAGEMPSCELLVKSTERSDEPAVLRCRNIRRVPHLEHLRRVWMFGWRLPKLMLDTWLVRRTYILYIPAARIETLKMNVCESMQVSTGDVIQALSTLLYYAAIGINKLPQNPKFQEIIVQRTGLNPTYFGNKVIAIPVSLKPGIDVNNTGPADMLRELANGIRLATIHHKTFPEYNKESLLQFVAVLLEMLNILNQSITALHLFIMAYIDSNLLVTTNNLPECWHQETSFGPDTSATAGRLPYLYPNNVVAIRPAMPPYGKGIFIELNLTRKQLQRVRRHSILELVPDITFLGLGETGITKSK